MIKKAQITIALITLLMVGQSAEAGEVPSGWKQLSVPAYRDKLKGGFVGQMAGVTFGAPTEFRADGFTIPENLLPEWRPGMIQGALIQDDIYVELTFLQSLEKYGINATAEQVGKDFGNSKYMLWHANKFGRDNIRKGIMPPLSGHPKYNPHADDIDFQIEADIFGLISPGMVRPAQEFGWDYGHIMNYGDGVYGGIFISAMYSSAFFTNDRVKVVEAGLAAIPAESNYAKTIQDVLAAYQENPADWKYAWRKIEDKWGKLTHCPDQHFLYPWRKQGIGANVNGAYVVIGLLYGNGDPLRTMKIATMCGRDSDCNPASAMGILGTMIGFENLPADFKPGLEKIQDKKFSYTNYTWQTALSAMETQARKVLLQQGGKETDQVWLIQTKSPLKLPLEQWPMGANPETLPVPKWLN